MSPSTLIIIQKSLYVVTQNDSVYAFDGSNCTPLLQTSLLLNASQGEEAVQCGDLPGNCKTIAPTIGALGTPVIDPASGTLYVVTESECPGNTTCNQGSLPVYYHYLHALDLTTLSVSPERYSGPVQVYPPGSNSSLWSKNHIQRPGLLLQSAPAPAYPTVYIAFSMMDGAPTPYPTGWVFAYDAQNLQSTSYPLAFNTVPSTASTANGGGIWEGGAGLALGADSDTGQSYIYVATGNGTWDAYNSNPPNTDYGEAFIKLKLDLSGVADYFATAQAIPLGCPCKDFDFGSGGVMLIPDDLLPGSYSHMAIMADKEGKIYVVDRHTPGGYTGVCSTTMCPATGCMLPTCTGTDANLESITEAPNLTFHNTAAYWNNTLYYAQAAGHPLKKYLVTSSCPVGSPAGAQPPICTTSVASTVTFKYGATPAVSSNGTSNAVVWAILSNNPPENSGFGTLYAFDNNLNQLYNSDMCSTGADKLGNAMKFSVPTIANGFVYAGGEQSCSPTTTCQWFLNIYGKKSRQSC
jgi:hypothetical protein